MKGSIEVGLLYGGDQGEHKNVDDVKYPNEGRLRVGYVFMIKECVVQHMVSIGTVYVVQCLRRR